ncbi:MAG: hypothetical protein IJ966_07065 [Bacilli bacterium]|nr:hypothetical protein [Bacilli bacterium]
MGNIDKVIDTFIAGDYFIIFLILMLIILVVLILALIKSRQDYNEILNMEIKNKKEDILEDLKQLKEETTKEDSIIPESVELSTAEKLDNLTKETDNFFAELDNLKATSKEEEIDMDIPLIKQIDIPGIMTYDDVISEYENKEEEMAVISAEELERKTKERMETLGLSDNQAAIARYEEEQENKAIISYEQLLKNASNITLSYKKEEQKSGAPVINKIEIEQKEVTQPENYLGEEEFLKILKEFRLSL